MKLAAVRRFTQYVAALAIFTAGPAALAQFVAPYGLPHDVEEITPFDDEVFGDWTWNVGNGNSIDGSLDLSFVPGSIELSAAYFETASGYELRTTAVPGYLDVAFSIERTEGTALGGWFRSSNETYYAITGEEDVNFIAVPGETFGFWVSAFEEAPFVTMEVWNFSAIPEPAGIAGWMGAGVAVLTAMRELRRRRRLPPVA